ncbi:unnamed protein product [Allacma fusca]|uniref:Cyanocobalamin reductase (cyanide-eliminating) n=1 Tax=Allacma fusca TaxID=39272 RepID=A0A8J2Q087_9HEXA|nr:unnamed protein product [Allacma fusca]
MLIWLNMKLHRDQILRCWKGGIYAEEVKMENSNTDINSNSRMLPEQISEIVHRIFGPADLHVHPFLIGWYNELVGSKFALNVPEDTVAFVVISGPTIFEKCVIPFLRNQVGRNNSFCTIDPLDETMKFMFRLFLKELEAQGFETEAFHDFDLFPNRRPKVLVQTAAHVAGAAEYFLESRLTCLESIPKKKLFGVAVHPEYGGWFAIRGIIILKNVREKWEPPPPLNILPDESKIAFLLEQFTYNWKANIWRDVVPVKNDVRYSADFLEYLETDPNKRWDFIVQKGYLGDMECP